MKVKHLIKLLRELDQEREVTFHFNDNSDCSDLRSIVLADVETVEHVVTWDCEKEEDLKEPRLERGPVNIIFNE